MLTVLYVALVISAFIYVGPAPFNPRTEGIADSLRNMAIVIVAPVLCMFIGWLLRGHRGGWI